jgi:BirA family transcriptional regulator, biotin operon repressor / biotin---[acetyl-CoA-carboxylase] ligase
VRSSFQRVIRHELVDSTNERALAAISAGEALDGDVHVAQGQTAGRGRRGARWESAPGEGLYASFVLMPRAPAPPAPAVTAMAGLAVLDALRELGLERARLKWPNDVLVGEAKLAGILVETRGLDPAAPHFVVGIGLNVAQSTFPAELERERAVTSLAREGSTAGVEDVLARLLAALPERWRQARAARELLARDYLAAAGLENRSVRATLASEQVEGRAVGLDFARGLRLALAGGVERVLALEHVRALDPI